MAATQTLGPSRLILFEDDHLLVVNKPSGWNTHAPAPFAGEGLYDWLRHREPRWASLAIIHRLDKETSGLIVFGKTPEANRSLTAQFAERRVKKAYVLVTDRDVRRATFSVSSMLSRVGEKYSSRPVARQGEQAETSFRVLASNAGLTTVEATPKTGRTHQIRVHAAESGFPILGDVLYGGTPAPRVHLQAAHLSFTHPVTGQELSFESPVDFAEDPRSALRAALIDSTATDAFRLIQGAADGWPGFYVDAFGPHLLAQSETPLNEADRCRLQRVGQSLPAPVCSIHHKVLNRRVRQSSPSTASPQLVIGDAAPERFNIRENSLTFELSFKEGYSVGLFLDQRDNRRRFLVNHVAAGFPLFDGGPAGKEVLNAFAYTCGFSVCAAKAGTRTTSLDLSKKYLEWGKRNFALNGLDAAQHDFIYGDAFDWLRRLAKKQRLFDVVILDPPTFSQSKESGTFRVEKDFSKLVAAALPVLKPDGVLFASTNAASLEPAAFLQTIEVAVAKARCRILSQHYVPQPPDFPVTREEPAYLKTVWVRLAPR
jgi:23S rRNA (cytosine1962-C5)-methyltransferase